MSRILFTAIIVLVLALGSYGYLVAPPRESTQSREASAPMKAPPLTPQITAQLEKSRGFQALVSYTDRGFEPATVTIKKGQTVRFTNNSSDDVWIAASSAGGGKLYPRVQDECGSSTFDTCKGQRPQEFWEFTFDIAGTWGYADNLHKGNTGIVVVK